MYNMELYRGFMSDAAIYRRFWKESGKFPGEMYRLMMGAFRKALECKSDALLFGR